MEAYLFIYLFVISGGYWLRDIEIMLMWILHYIFDFGSFGNLCIRLVTFMSLNFWKYLLAFFWWHLDEKISIVKKKSLWWLTRFQAAAVSVKGKLFCLFYGLFFMRSDRKQGGRVCNQSSCAGMLGLSQTQAIKSLLRLIISLPM